MDDRDEQLITQRKQKLFELISKKNDWLVYAGLILVIFLSLWIRTLNVPGLIDVSTGQPTLGPDLDPFLFLRWSQYIVDNGRLFTNDAMRYVPLGFNTEGEYLLHPYMMAWFHNIFSGTFGWSVTQSAIYYPVFMFGLTIIAFFLFVRKAFNGFTSKRRANAISLVASLFLGIMPSLLPRTIAGIPEKESVAFFFLFMAFYLFLSSWNALTPGKRIVTAVLAGMSTAAMGFVWGGYVFIFYIISPALLVTFLTGAMKKNNLFATGTWLLSSFVFMILFFERFNLRNIFSSATTGSAILVFLAATFHIFIFTPHIKEKLYSKVRWLNKVPGRITSFVLVLAICLIIGTVFFGVDAIFGNFSNIYFNLVKPAQSRLINTVAENRQPYFNEWASNFGPQIGNLYIGLTLMLISSVVLFYQLCLRITSKRNALWMISAYTLMLVTTVFSRYSAESTLNGENAISLTLYAAGFLVFVYICGRYALKAHKNMEGRLFNNAHIGILILLIFLIVSIVSARGLIRLVMVMVAPGAVMLGFLAVQSFANLINSRKEREIAKLAISIILIVGLLFSAYTYYTISKNTAKQYIPSSYTNQWQKAMDWVREETPTNSVFGHWWDYGYWLQSIGNRATVLDGGNAISYWNHLMGRHALTSPNERAALEFLYAHNTTHFLIDSSDIGKYGAFSSIGSDKNYDRRSWISPFLRDASKTVERKNSTLYIYPAGTVLDEDIYYSLNGTQLFLPASKTIVAAFVSEVLESKVTNVQAIFVYQNQQYSLPLRYFYEDSLVDMGEGVDAGVFFFPRIVQSNEGGYIDQGGALLYLSPRVVHSQLARLYLFGEEKGSFSLAHSEPDAIVENLRGQGITIGDFIFFNEFRGPLKIWELNYPSDIKFKPEYLETEYPQELVRT